MTDKDLKDNSKAAVLTERDIEVVTGGGLGAGGLNQVRHYCGKCKKKTMQYKASNGFVCSACGTLNA